MRVALYYSVSMAIFAVLLGIHDIAAAVWGVLTIVVIPLAFAWYGCGKKARGEW